MKTAIIIVFYNNQTDIDVDFFINYLNKSNHIRFCLVNNASEDNTYRILIEIKDLCPNVSIVNIKKNKKEISAVRSGVRYMINKYSIDNFGYVNSNLFQKNKKELNNILINIIHNETLILAYKKNIHPNSSHKKTLFQSLFSLIDYLKEYRGYIQTIHLYILTIYLY